jgi:hypothetical protein
MTDRVSFRFIGPDTGIARLVTDLELAGADAPVIAERGPDDGDPDTYSGTLTGLTAEQATAVTLTYLATTSGQRAWINDEEILGES